MSEPVVAVIGCGNIGSRHLQGLARLDRPARIVGCDPLADSRQLSATRFAQMNPGPHLDVSFCESLEDLPDRIDLAIVATSTPPRRAITEALVARRDVKALILEKFLFQSHADHIAVGDLLADRRIPTWVNTPRRAWPVYRQLAADLAGTGGVSIAVEFGRANGLGTNAIHMIDLAAFLTGQSGGFDLDGRRLTPVEGVSRHAGLLDFGGVLTGVSADGHLVSIRGRPGSTEPHVVTILAEDRRLVINEVQQKAYVATAASAWAPVEQPFPIVNQSSLTGEFAAAIFDRGEAPLPGFAESARLHRQCLAAFLQATGRDPADLEAKVAVT